MTWTLVEPTQALRDWLRTQADVTDHFGQRIYAGGAPQGATYPLATIRRIGGGFEDMVDVGLYQIDVWADKASTAATAASDVAALLTNTRHTAIDTDLYLEGAEATALLFVPDPNPALQRYSLTVQITTKSTGT